MFFIKVPAFKFDKSEFMNKELKKEFIRENTQIQSNYYYYSLK